MAGGPGVPAGEGSVLPLERAAGSAQMGEIAGAAGVLVSVRGPEGSGLSGSGGAPAGLQVEQKRSSDELEIKSDRQSVDSGTEFNMYASTNRMDAYSKQYIRVFSSCCPSVLGDAMSALEISHWLEAAKHAANTAEFVLGSLPGGLLAFSHLLIAQRLGPAANRVAIRLGHEHGCRSVGEYLEALADEAMKASSGFVRSRAAARRLLFACKQEQAESVRIYMNRLLSVAESAVVGMWARWPDDKRNSWHRETVNALHEGLSSSLLRRALVDAGVWHPAGGRFKDYWSMIRDRITDLDDDVSGGGFGDSRERV